MTDTPSTRIVSGASTGPLSIVVLGEHQLATHPLPAAGTVSLGRSPSCDIPIFENAISRHHAILRIGETLTIEDLASANGTRVGGTQLAPHRPTVVRHGDVIELGETTLLVQRRALPATPRRLWSHGYFEGRLDDECARAGEPTEFAVVFLHCEGKPPAEAVQAVLAELLRPIDVAGEYGAGEYELLLVDTPAAPARERAEALVARLARRRIAARVGVASFPGDGRTPDLLLEHAATRARPRAPGAPGGIVVGDSAMIQLRRVIDRVAVGTLSVLLLGETGVGKEVLAALVHQRSPRSEQPFLRLNCAAMTESLLESELFGHEKGAFTGAIVGKLGLLETAHGGTVFLDEIGELSPAIQVKLLRVLEDRLVTPVGGLKAKPIDVRFVAATNRDLELEIARGRFRQDLYYRLAGITLVIPPLRERVSEIVPLAHAFIAAACAGRGRAPTIEPAAVDLLTRYAWPGNIRELRNVIERAVLLCAHDVIRVAHLPVDKMRATYAAPRAAAPSSPDEPAASTSALEALYPGDPERERIIATLELCRGNQTKAAHLLGMSRRTLVYRLERYGLPRPRKGR